MTKKDWMWCDASNNPMQDKVRGAIKAYTDKHEHKPDVCYVYHGAWAQSKVIDGVLIELASNVPLNHFRLGILPYYLVYQVRSVPTGKKKKGKSLDAPLIHIMHGGKGICGVKPMETVVEKNRVIKVTSPGIKLMRLELGQIVSGMEWCYECAWTGRAREGIPDEIKELIDA